MFDYANYNLLNYLQVPGASYIELNDYADWDTDSLEIRCSWNSSEVNEMVLSFGGTETKAGWLYSYQGSQYIDLYYFVDSGSQIRLGYCPQVESLETHTYTIDLQNKAGNRDWESNLAMSNGSVTSHCDYKIRLFSGGGASYANAYYFNGKFYHFTQRRSGNVIHELRPAQRRSDNTLGLYDTIANVFYTNSGTNAFIAGPVAGGGN